MIITVFNFRTFCFCSALLVTPFSFGASVRIPIKVIQEPATYGNIIPAAAHGASRIHSAKRPSPSNFSGPPHLTYLRGHCYNLSDSKYRYVLCPFKNISQYETTYRWNAYEGVLGIWKHWEIVNNTFVSMIFEDGDSCGSTARTVKVRLVCGSSTRLQNVTEPKQCQYEAKLESPYVCGPDSLLVYPSLDGQAQRRWDKLESLLRYGDITQKGYDHWLEELLVDSGVRQRKGRPQVRSTTPKPSHFGDLNSCNVAYEDMKQMVERLQAELAELRPANNGSTSVDNL